MRKKNRRFFLDSGLQRKPEQHVQRVVTFCWKKDISRYGYFFDTCLRLPFHLDIGLWHHKNTPLLICLCHVSNLSLSVCLIIPDRQLFKVFFSFSQPSKFLSLTLTLHNSRKPWVHWDENGGYSWCWLNGTQALVVSVAPVTPITRRCDDM